MTFSIMATDPITNQVGYAVASKTFSVGMIGFSEPGVGAVLCQGETNFGNGPMALGLMRGGKTLEEVLAEIRSVDSRIEHQQLGMVDTAGEVLAFTGSECGEWAGHVSGDGYTCQGNLLVGPGVVDRMREVFESTEGWLVEQLMAALVAGDQAGGDKRGKQSASIKVVSPGGGFGGSDTVAEFHIYDQVDPVVELSRVSGIAVGYMKQFLGG